MYDCQDVVAKMTDSANASSGVVGRSAVVVPSDPYELSPLPGEAGLAVLLVDAAPAGPEHKERVLARLENPIVWQGDSVTHVVIEPRQGIGLFARLESGETGSPRVPRRLSYLGTKFAEAC